MSSFCFESIGAQPESIHSAFLLLVLMDAVMLGARQLFDPSQLSVMRCTGALGPLTRGAATEAKVQTTKFFQSPQSGQ